jgi:hypothetical protein
MTFDILPPWDVAVHISELVAQQAAVKAAAGAVTDAAGKALAWVRSAPWPQPSSRSWQRSRQPLTTGLRKWRWRWN